MRRDDYITIFAWLLLPVVVFILTGDWRTFAFALLISSSFMPLALINVVRLFLKAGKFIVGGIKSK
jgi:hypothetical protein